MESLINEINSLEVLKTLPSIGLKDLVEIMILAFLIYYCAKNIKGTRAWVLAKGIIIVLGFYTLAYIFKLDVITSIFQSVLVFVVLAFIVAVQPEIRKFVENVGRTSFDFNLIDIINGIAKGKLRPVEVKQTISDETITELVKSCFSMGKVKTGALIAIERETPLNEYVDSGIGINADISAALILNTFEKNTPLHDGGVIIQNNKLTAATCYFPLSNNPDISKDLGTRHRAAIGLTEVTDALVIVVSEETGAVSVSVNGEIHHNIDREQLTEELVRFQNKHTVEIKRKLDDGGIAENANIKLASLLSSLIIWMLVITSTNPVISKTFKNIPIEVTNETAISELDKTYEILGQSNVSITFTDNKNIVDLINQEDIRVVADLSKLSITNSVNLDVEVPNFPDTEYRLSNPTIQISIEDIISTEVSVATNIISKPNEKYYVSSVDLDTDTIIISGASSIVGTIGSVTVDIDESKITSNTELKLLPNVYDRNGNKIDTSRLELSQDIISAKVNLFNTKTIPLNITTKIDDEAISKMIDNITYDEKTISVAGPDELLDKLKSIDIEVPLDSSMFDMTKRQFIKNISIQSYVPEGVIVTSNLGNVNIVVNFKELNSTNIKVNPSDIKINEAPNGRKVTIKDKDSLDVNVVSISNISNITIDTIKPYINVAGLGTGEHKVKVKFNTVDFGIIGDYEVTIDIT